MGKKIESAAAATGAANINNFLKDVALSTPATYLQKNIRKEKVEMTVISDRRRKSWILGRSRDSESCRVSSSMVFASLFLSSIDMTDFSPTQYSLFSISSGLYIGFLSAKSSANFTCSVFAWNEKSMVEIKCCLRENQVHNEINNKKILKCYSRLHDIQARYVLKKHTVIIFNISPSVCDKNQSQLLSVNAKNCTPRGDCKNTSFQRRRRRRRCSCFQGCK